MRFLSLGQRGFSLVEMMIASGLTGAIVLGASSVMNNTVTSQKKIEVQSLIEREFALGSQIAANGEILRKVLTLAGSLDPNDTCILRDRNFSETRAGRTSINCQAVHPGNWNSYPANPPAALRLPVFNNSFSLLKSNCVADPQAANRCHAIREMAWRWVCTPEECSGIETKVVVRPLFNQENSFRPREVVVKLDRRQLFSKAEIQFICNAAGRSLTTLDYDQARDICTDQPVTDCVALPNQTYNPFASSSTNCAPPLYSSCPDGYEFTGLYNAAGQCRPAPPPRVGSGPSEPVAGAVYTPNPPPETRTNASTSYQTYTNTLVTTVTETVVGPPAAPTCDTTMHTLYGLYRNDIQAWYFTSDQNEPTATAQGYYFTGTAFPVFSGACEGQRVPLTECFKSVSGIGIHYLSGNPNCDYGGIPTLVGYTQITSSPGATRELKRYYYGGPYQSHFATPEPSGPTIPMTYEGGMGWIP
jgi:prepilin-type N-terminal cleavage/methylation domain-containing protein